MCASSLIQDACLHPTACSAALRFMQISSQLLMSRSGHVHSSHALVRCRRIRASRPTSGSRLWTVSRVLTEGWIMGSMVTPRMCHRRVCCPLSFAAMHDATGARTVVPSGSCLHVFIVESVAHSLLLLCTSRRVRALLLLLAHVFMSAVLCEICLPWWCLHCELCVMT